MNYDFIVIGAGVIGLTIAEFLSGSAKDAKILIIEKERSIGEHGSGRNSGVLHSGLYYPSKSLKAKICSIGSKKMKDFCSDNSLKIKQIGKVIVPTKIDQDPTLDKLLRRGLKNKSRVELVDEKTLLELEPMVRSPSGRAIFSPNTSIVEPIEVLKKLKEIITSRGVKINFNESFVDFDYKSRLIKTSKGSYSFGHLFNSSGQFSDYVAKKFDIGSDYLSIPFRGAYYKLANSSNITLKRLIYPVPDMNMPFLGIHSVTSISGESYFGPSAFPAFGRENYELTRNIDFFQTLKTFKTLFGMYVSNKQNFREYSHQEILRIQKNHFIRSAKILVPALESKMLQKATKVGIRAQLFSKKSKELVMDLVIERNELSTHVLNSVSPAFTCSFEIAKHACKNLI